MSDDLHWKSAGEIAGGIRSGDLSSREVLDHLVARIGRLDGPVNSVVHWDLERARLAADEADRAVERGDDLGPLHGVPMTIKDSFQTEGCITTSGSPDLADHLPTEDAWPVARLREAGAIPFAKTNLPIYAGDIQTYNDVYGTTNNPHNVEYTPGGSSGGSAAALAMGFTPIELGSDIGGSIRVPAHYSGVVGHKPSFGIVPGHGQIPGPPGTFSQADLAVSGPMARSVADLDLMLDVLAGPDRWSTPAWRLDLPSSRVEGLRGARIAAWIDDPFCPVDSDTRRALEATVADLEAVGCIVDTEARPAFTLEQVFGVFADLLFAALAGGHPKDKIEYLAQDTSDTALGRVKRGSAVRHRDWLSANERRQQYRERWAEFFSRFDAVVMPVQPRPAIPHDHSEPQFGRTVDIGGIESDYIDLFTWIAPAGAALLPATVVPVGMGADDLPVGVQIVGPFLHDRTTIRLGEFISDLRGGCPRPALATDG